MWPISRTPNGVFTLNQRTCYKVTSILFLKKTKAVDLIGRLGKLVDVVMQGTVLSLEGETRVSRFGCLGLGSD